MPVYYDGNNIIPAPFAEINKEYTSSADGRIIGSLYRINLTGDLVAYRGTPTSSGTLDNSGNDVTETVSEDARMAAILRKQEALRYVFSNQGRTLEIAPWDGSQSIKCYPRNISISFEQGQWFETCGYTISMEADNMVGDASVLGGPDEDEFDEFIASADESWQIELNEESENETNPQSFRVTHTVSAVGKSHYNEVGNLGPDGDPVTIKYAWEWAKDWVVAQLGFDTNVGLGTIIPSDYEAHDYVRTESPDIRAGSYQVTETWILTKDKKVVETFTVTMEENLENSLVNVSINGEIKGLHTRNASTFDLEETKYEAASGYFSDIQGDLITRAELYSGQTLNVQALNSSVAHAPTVGTISYTYTYDTRPSNLIDDSRTESIRISNDNPYDIIASQFVLGRQKGPILQQTGSKSQRIRTISIEAAMAVPTGTISQRIAAAPDVDSIVNDAKPTATQTYSQQDSDDWDINTGRFTRIVQWVWEVD